MKQPVQQGTNQSEKTLAINSWDIPADSLLGLTPQERAWSSDVLVMEGE